MEQSLDPGSLDGHPRLLCGDSSLEVRTWVLTGLCIPAVVLREEKALVIYRFEHLRVVDKRRDLFSSSMDTTDDPNPSLLVVVVDADAEQWKTRTQSKDQKLVRYDELVGMVTLFCNAYSLMHRQNRLSILASSDEGCKQIYPRREDEDSNEDFLVVGHTLPPTITSGLLGDDLTKGMAGGSNAGTDGGTALAKCLSRALCIINRQMRFHADLQSRILVLKIAKDHSPSYNSVMNSIFSADKLNVPVDSVVLGAKDSLFLQQASFLTNGVYLKPEDQKNLLQLLLTHCVSSSHTRKLGLNTPKQEAVDFRASCFCHRKPVEFAYMCSVCLALTCEPTDVCRTCSSERVSAPS